MRVDTLLILLGILYAIKGRRSKIEEDKIGLYGVSVGFLVSSVIVLIINLL